MIPKFSRAILFAALSLTASAAWANHPVLVEGNCDSPVPGTTIVLQNACGDFDGDGRIGTAEDTDGADRIFGTISAALGPGTGAAAGTGANMNGTITIVTSGRFAEILNLPGSIVNPGNVTIKAAPGVEAQIDAVLQGDPAGGNTSRQSTAGIVILMPADRRVVLENLTIRNWVVGVHIGANSRVSIINCRITNNLNYGVFAFGNALITIDESQVVANGFRVPVTTAPNPGGGVAFFDNASGAVFRIQISENFSTGLADQSTGTTTVQDVYLFGNNPNF